MISKKMAGALNKQLNAEAYSAYLYMSMSAYALSAGFKGSANWLNVQAQEETVHARKFYDYIISQDGRVVLAVINEPPSEFKSLQNVFEETLKHEKKVTALINELVGLARTEGDHATESFLQWFVNEQVEEESSARDVVDRIKLAGGPGPGLFMVDSELAARVFVSSVAQKQV